MAEKEIKDKDKTKSSNGRSKIFTAAEVKEIKLEAKEFEKRNNSKLMVFASSSGWWKMGGNSALIYAHILSRDLHLPSTPRVRLDKDLYGKFFEGVLSIPNIDSLTERLEAIGVKVEDKNERRVIFALPKPIQEDQLETIRSIREETLRKINETIPVRVIYPEVLIQQRKVALKMRTLLSNASKVDADICVTKMARTAWEDVILLGKMSRRYDVNKSQELSAYEILKQIFKDNEELEMNIQMMVDADMISADEAMKVVMLTQDANTLIQAEGKKLGNKENAKK